MVPEPAPIIDEDEQDVFQEKKIKEFVFEEKKIEKSIEEEKEVVGFKKRKGGKARGNIRVKD